MFEPASSSATAWGSCAAQDVIRQVTDAYEQVIVCRKNHYKLPSVGPGKKFVSQMTALLKEWNLKGPL